MSFNNNKSLDECNKNQLTDLRNIIRFKLTEAVLTKKSPLYRYSLNPGELNDVQMHISNILKTGRTSLKLNEYTTVEYFAEQKIINAVFDSLALKYHESLGKQKKYIYFFLLDSLNPISRNGKLNAIGTIVFKLLNRYSLTNENVDFQILKIINEEYPDEQLDVLKNIHFGEKSGLEKALLNYQKQTSSFISFYIKVMSQQMIDSHRKKFYTQDGLRMAYKTYSLDEPIDLNVNYKNHTSKKTTGNIDYNSFPMKPMTFIDNLINKAAEEEDDNWFKTADIHKLKKAVLDFILTKLDKHNKIKMLEFFRFFYVLGITDFNILAKKFNISNVAIRVLKTRLEDFITSFVKTGEFQAYIQKKVNIKVTFPNNEFKTNKTQF